MRPEQSWKMSAVEQVARMTAMFFACLGLQFLVFPLVGYHPTLTEALGLQVAFTGVSFLTGFAVRRIFERWVR